MLTDRNPNSEMGSYVRPDLCIWQKPKTHRISKDLVIWGGHSTSYHRCQISTCTQPTKIKLLPDNCGVIALLTSTKNSNLLVKLSLRT